MYDLKSLQDTHSLQPVSSVSRGQRPCKIKVLHNSVISETSHTHDLILKKRVPRHFAKVHGEYTVWNWLIVGKVISHNKRLCTYVPSTLQTQKKLKICSYSWIAGNLSRQTHKQVWNQKTISKQLIKYVVNIA